MLKAIYVAIGGAIGALLRYTISGIIHDITNTSFPWGTMIVNVGGSLAIGILWTIFEETTINPSIRLLVLIGIIGSFTTLSTYGIETVNLLRDGQLKPAITNIVLTNILSITMVIIGIVVSKYIMLLSGKYR